jgi:hypothetical protein
MASTPQLSALHPRDSSYSHPTATVGLTRIARGIPLAVSIRLNGFGRRQASLKKFIAVIEVARRFA